MFLKIIKSKKKKFEVLKSKKKMSHLKQTQTLNAAKHKKISKHLFFYVKFVNVLNNEICDDLRKTNKKIFQIFFSCASKKKFISKKICEKIDCVNKYTRRNGVG